MQKSLQSFLIFLAAATMFACSNTPNMISMTVTPGVCVQPSMYVSSVTPSPAISGNPANAPYCASVTIQNNNSGLNANNIQITSSGLQASYTVGTTSYPPTIMYDPVAATLAIGGATQMLGNLTIYDPKNCASTAGPNVVSLSTGGVTCTFYLQLSGESNPVGVYPTTLTYNYTNGNQNYSISTNFNQRVNLYAGATSGLFFNNTTALGGTTNTAVWSIPQGMPAAFAVTSLIADGYGNVYVAGGNSVYVYNGLNLTQLGEGLPASVLSLAFDSNGNLYAATTAGMYYYNSQTNPTTWNTFNGGGISSNSTIIGLKGNEYAGSASPYLYAITATDAYTCTAPNPASGTCNWLQINTWPNSPAIFYQNALDIDPSSNLYTGSFQSAFSYSPGIWREYTFSNGTVISGQIYGVRYNTFSTTSPLYLGEIPASANLASESSIFICNSSAVCSPLLSSTGSSVTGNTIAIATDGVGNLYIGGNSMNSPDFSATATNVFATYLLINSTSGAANWLPIANGALTSGQIQSMLVSSMLTTY